MPRHELLVETVIEASPERVWAILTDFAAYPEWNPFIRVIEIEGDLRVGARLRARIQPSGGKGMTFRPTVLVADPGRELRWIGHLFLPGIFDGEHYFAIRPRSDRTILFQHGEEFRGLLIPSMRKSLDRDTRRGFVEMNEALKARAESSLS
jgi:hypothetical protein